MFVSAQYHTWQTSTHYLQLGELADVRGELHQVIVSHVECPQALPQVGKVGGEGGAGQVVVGQVQDLQRREGAKASGQFTQPVHAACTWRYKNMHVHACGKYYHDD